MIWRVAVEKLTHQKCSKKLCNRKPAKRPLGLGRHFLSPNSRYSLGVMEVQLVDGCSPAPRRRCTFVDRHRNRPVIPTVTVPATHGTQEQPGKNVLLNKAPGPGRIGFMAPAALTVEGFSLHGWYLPSLLFRLNHTLQEQADCSECSYFINSFPRGFAKTKSRRVNEKRPTLQTYGLGGVGRFIRLRNYDSLGYRCGT